MKDNKMIWAGYGIIVMLFAVSLFNGGFFIGYHIYGQVLVGYGEMLAMEVALLFLMMGIANRERDWLYLLYIAIELYIISAIAIANYLQLMEGFMGGQVAWLKSDPTWYTGMGGIYAFTLPVLTFAIGLVVNDIRKKAQKEQPKTFRDVSLKGEKQEDIVDKWRKDNNRTARDPGDN